MRLLLLATLQLHALAPEEILVFYHLPKCGGTTVTSLVGQKFHSFETARLVVSPEQRFTPEQLGPLKTKAAHYIEPLYLSQTTSAVRFIHGHFAYHPDKELPKVRNFTFLRDPVERVFSTYRYACCTRKIDFFDLCSRVSNLQSIRLSGLPRNDPTISLRDHLESSKQNLANHFFFVGITEEMEASMEALYKLLGWEPLSCVPSFNITLKKPHDPDLYAFVVEQEWADRELYEFAKTLFAQHLEKARSILAPPKPVSYTNTVHFDIEDPLDGEGWGYKELDLETDTRLRQSYQKDAFIRFPLAQENYLMKAKISFARPEMLRNFQLLANGRTLEYSLIDQGKWKLLQAAIPLHYIGRESTVFTFHVSDLYIPLEHENVPDHRKMGIAITQIDIEPTP